MVAIDCQVIIRQNEPGHSFFIVKEGEVQCFVNQKLVKTYGPSEYFGEGLIAIDCLPHRSTLVSARERLRDEPRVAD